MRLGPLLLMLAATACNGASLEDRARDDLSSVLKDPDSARFRNLREDPPGGICGEVNSKNSYGAYSGYQRFWAYRGQAFIADQELSGFIAKQCDEPATTGG